MNWGGGGGVFFLGCVKKFKRPVNGAQHTVQQKNVESSFWE